MFCTVGLCIYFLPVQKKKRQPKRKDNPSEVNDQNGRRLPSLNKKRLQSRPDVDRLGVLHCCTRQRLPEILGGVRSVALGVRSATDLLQQLQFVHCHGGKMHQNRSQNV